MKGTIICTVKEAVKLMKHLKDDDVVTFTIVDTEKYVHSEPKRIKKKYGVKLLGLAEMIEYQDNDIFGRFSLFGMDSNKKIIQNILFPQIE